MIQNILDEVLDGDPRYTIKEDNGEVFQDNMDIVLRTPVVQEGTPINRALFRNLQGDLYTQDRYNKLENITYRTWQEDVPTSGNIFPTAILADWTENSTTNYTYKSTGAILTASSAYTSNGDLPIDVFGGGWQSSPSANSWIQLKLPTAKKITKMKIRVTSSSGSERFSSAIIEGSKNGSTWTTLYTISAYQSTATTVALDNPDYYTYYRVKVGLTGNYRALVSNWETVEYYAPKTFTDYYAELNLPLTSYEEGKIVNIQGIAYNSVTTFDNPYLNINKLGSKIINGTIRQGEKYTLIYNGTNWDILAKDYIIGTYTGDGGTVGTTTQTINIGFRPRAVIVFSGSGTSYMSTKDFPSVNVSSSDVLTVLTITDNGFEVYDALNSSTATRNPYRYIVFK